MHNPLYFQKEMDKLFYNPTQNIMFETEKDFFNHNLDSWLESYYGKYALIKSNELVGMYDTAQNAISEGYKRFGRSPIYVRLVTREEQIDNIPAYTFGLIHANPQ